MNAPGRPTLYRPEYARQARNYCLLGATNDDLADFFDVAPRTLDGWLASQPEFAEAVRAGRRVADAEVVDSLYRRALGYSYRTRKVVLHRGEEHTFDVEVHRPADVRACMFWLRNRRPAQWREGARPAPAPRFSLSELEAAAERARPCVADDGPAAGGGSGSVNSA